MKTNCHDTGKPARTPRGLLAVVAFACLLLTAAPARSQTLTANPPPNYLLGPDGLTLQITARLTNGRATTTNALRLELWAFALPFNLNPPAQGGYRLGTINLTALAPGAAVNVNQATVYVPPAAGVWTISLLALEDTGGAFVVRDFFNFPAPLPVAGIMATYPSVRLPGLTNNTPVRIENLLLDASRLYWVVVESSNIGSVGLTPGSAPATLTTFAGGMFNPLQMVQDNLNLYVLRATDASYAEVFRVVKASGTQVTLAVPGGGNGINNAALGISHAGNTLHLAAFRNAVPATGFVGTFKATLPTQGGPLVVLGPVTGVNTTRQLDNMSPTSFAADLTSMYWIDTWDDTIRQVPLFGSANGTAILSLGPGAANFLSAPTQGPAGGSLFWLETINNQRVLRRRVGGSGGVVINVFAGVGSTNYALDGDRVYLVPTATQQMSWVPIGGGPATPMLTTLDTGGAGEIVTDGNAIYWASLSFNPQTPLQMQLKRLPLPATGAPVLVQAPVSVQVAPINAGNVTFTALAASGGLSYVWLRNGEVLVPATTTAGASPSTGATPPRASGVVASSANTATLTLTNVTAADVGFYSCRITNSLGTIETNAAFLSLDTGGTSRLINVSTRGQVPAGAALTPGFVMRGPGSKQLLIRAIGPTLSTFGLVGLADTRMDVVNQQTGATVTTNDDWGGGTTLSNSFSTLGAFPLADTSKDSAALAGLPVNSGGYSVRITSPGAAGVALAEVYDADPLTSPAKLINVSTLGFAGTGADALASGFVIGGTVPKTVLIRVVGPGLAAFGVGGTMADPQLTVVPLGLNVTVARNDDWGGTAELKAAFATAGAFALPDASKDAAVVVRLPPGGFTVVVAGAGTTTGTTLVEVYDLDP